MRRLPQLACTVIGAAMFVISSVNLANAQSLRAGIAAFMREDYVRAADIFGPLADRGNPVAQFHLCFMYANGRGVQQNYAEAAMWCHRAAEQGNPPAQYLLGLLFDKGQGVPVNWVQAHKWLNLAASHAPPRDRAAWTRVRDAVASKMSVGQLAAARQLALDWRPTPEQ